MSDSRPSRISLGHVPDPAEAARLATLRDDCDLLAFAFLHRSADNPDREPILLHALVDTASGRTAISGDSALLDTVHSRAELAALPATYQPDVPLVLTPVRIPKPWGEEIWFTGIEARGVSLANGIPLDQLLAVHDRRVLGDHDMPLLLKILAPHADPVLGDLYFELHNQKVEVYVVTGIDELAWPDGSGAIRLGFNASTRDRFSDELKFRDAYLEAVKEYEAVRAEIDALLDDMRMAAGIPLDAVIAPEVVNSWLAQLPPDLTEREARCRDGMHSFTQLWPLAPGDVVRVPPGTPHSLQHGVRVVEFQTPHYERYIISFAQKVLTQGHWDTDAAMDQIKWDATLQNTFEQAAAGNGYTVERIADFGEFTVLRIDLAAASGHALPLSSYAVVMGVTGTLNVNGILLSPEQACLVPATSTTLCVEAPAGPARFLVAVPGNDS